MIIGLIIGLFIVGIVLFIASGSYSCYGTAETMLVIFAIIFILASFGIFIFGCFHGFVNNFQIEMRFRNVAAGNGAILHLHNNRQYMV